MNTVSSIEMNRPPSAIPKTRDMAGSAVMQKQASITRSAFFAERSNSAEEESMSVLLSAPSSLKPRSMGEGSGCSTGVGWVSSFQKATILCRRRIQIPNTISHSVTATFYKQPDERKKWWRRGESMELSFYNDVKCDFRERASEQWSNWRKQTQCAHRHSHNCIGGGVTICVNGTRSVVAQTCKWRTKVGRIVFST